jgi:hypothetical protein
MNIKYKLREELNIILEGLTQSINGEKLIQKLESLNISPDDIYYNDGKINFELKLKYKDIVIPMIKKMETIFGWYLAGYQEDFHEPINSNVDEFKNDLSFNLETIESNGWDEDDMISKLIFEPKFGEEISSENLPDILYHVTDEKYLNGIKSIGLKPTHKNKISYHPERIYLLKNTDDANGLVDNINFDIENPILLSIDISQIKDKFKFYVDPNLPINGIYVLNNIPPNLIKDYKKF